MTADDGPPDPFGTLADATEHDHRGVKRLFARQAPAPADADSVWQALTTERSPTAEAEETIVSKGAYCERCPHLATPPVVRCSHPGTEIIDFPDTDHVRVRDCPYAMDNRDPPGREP